MFRVRRLVPSSWEKGERGSLAVVSMAAASEDGASFKGRDFPVRVGGVLEPPHACCKHLRAGCLDQLFEWAPGGTGRVLGALSRSSASIFSQERDHVRVWLMEPSSTAGTH